MAQQFNKYYFATGTEGPVQIPRRPSSMKDFSEEQLDEIYALYFKGMYISGIRSKFPEISSAAFEEQLPYIITDDKCEKCGSPLYVDYHRSTAHTSPQQGIKICIDCGHFTNNSSSCDCKYCQTDRNKEAEQTKEKWDGFINEFYPRKPKLDNIDLFDEVYLFLLINNFTDKKERLLNFLYSNSFSDGPDKRELDLVAAKFIERELLIPHPTNFNSPFFDANDWKDSKVGPKNRHKIHWDINLYTNEGKLSMTEFYDYFVNKELSAEEKSSLWRELYRYEITNYLHHINRIEANLKIDQFLTDYITDTMIEVFSLSKAFSFLYSGIKAALYYRAKYDANHHQVRGFFKNKIAYYAKEFANQKTQKAFNRPSYLEMNLLYGCIARQVLGLEQNYFYLQTAELIPDYQPEEFFEIN